jgi:UDP-N-acetylglucosamine 2-epimerase
MEPKKIVEIAERNGLQCIAITDHDAIQGAIEAKQYENKNITVIIGQEKTTDHGDLIGIKLQYEIKEFNFFKAVQEIKKQGGIAILPHPYKGHKDVEEIAKHVDLIEGLNSRTSESLNKKAIRLAKKLNKPVIAGSDAHLYREIGLVINKEQKKDVYTVDQFFHSGAYNKFISNIIKSFKTGNIKLLIKTMKAVGAFLSRSLIQITFPPVLRILRKVHFEVFFHRYKKEVHNPTMLFSSFLISWRNYIHKDGSSYAYDLMAGDVIEKAKETFGDISCIDICTNLLRPYSATKNKFKTTDQWVCFEQFITFKNIFLAFFLSMKKVFGHTLESGLELYLRTCDSHLYRNIFNFLTAEYVVDTVKPQSFFLICEYFHFHKAIVYASHFKHIPVFALQHGTIYPTHKGYMFDEEDKGIRLLPDITFVYGEQYYSLLTTKSIYDPHQVVITGSPRYDVLYHADAIYSREDFCKKHNINPEYHIVLWATQLNGQSERENRCTIETIFETIQALKDVTLIIKQHPDERDIDTKMLKDHLKKYDISFYFSSKFSDIYEQIFVSDIVISKFSTTIIEAILLNRPSIVLNLGGEQDVIDYVKEHIALGVYRKEDLKPTIEKLLIDDEELVRNREKYIKKYLYKLDGKAAERVIHSIQTYTAK